MKAAPKAQPGRKSTPSLPVLPVEWLDARAWRLPSGQPLADYALRAGFLAPRLLAPAQPEREGREVTRRVERKEA